jgi:hypothetical protein
MTPTSFESLLEGRDVVVVPRYRLVVLTKRRVDEPHAIEMTLIAAIFAQGYGRTRAVEAAGIKVGFIVMRPIKGHRESHPIFQGDSEPRLSLAPKLWQQASRVSFRRS